MLEINEEIMKSVMNKSYEFQMGCYFSNSEKIKGALLLWSDKINDIYWNYASKINVDESGKEKLIKKVIAFFREKNRQPELYITPFTGPKNLAEYAKTIGFKSVSKDAWMFYEGKEPRVKLPDNFSIKQVKTEEEMRIFIDVFHKAYSGATPDEPYGAIPKEYDDCLIRAFRNPRKKNKMINYLGMLDGIAVGVATLVFSENYGCIYNVGTVPAQRRKGVGAILTMTAVADYVKNNANVVFLQTEEGTANELYYKKLGFSTKFIGEALCWMLSITGFTRQLIRV